FRRSVKRGINLDSSETFRIKTEIIAGVHAARVEAAFPSSGSERRRSKKEAGNLVSFRFLLFGRSRFGVQFEQRRSETRLNFRSFCHCRILSRHLNRFDLSRPVNSNRMWIAAAFSA